jgi:four helix bundle protein
MAGNYKDLMVWRESILFVPEVYGILRRFPREEMFDLCSQIRRAVVSVPANIAEGQGRTYRKAFLQHLRIAKGSLAELHTLFVVSEQLGYISPGDLENIEMAIERIAKPLHGLISKVTRDVENGQ